MHYILRRQQYIGKVNHALFDSTGKKIVVLTDENVLALLHGGTGKSRVSFLLKFMVSQFLYFLKEKLNGVNCWVVVRKAKPIHFTC